MKAESANIWLLCAMSIVAMILFCCCVGPFTPFQDIGGDDSPQNSMPRVGSTQWMVQREKIYDDRNKRVQEACLDYEDVKESQTHGKSFSFDLRNNLAICMNPKVGFTAWMRNLMLLFNLTPNQKMLIDTPRRLHGWVQSHLVLKNEEKGDLYLSDHGDKHNFFKFSFVRHPYERLVSAYEDEVLHDPDSSSTYFDLMTKYDDISFARFVEYVLEAAMKQNCSSPGSECQINENFRPYHSNCYYCNVKYDFISRLEEFADDVMYIATKHNLTSLLPELMTSSRNSREQRISLNSVENYMAQLSVDSKRKLFELYELDFELFGYDPGDTICKNPACIE